MVVRAPFPPVMQLIYSFQTDLHNFLQQASVSSKREKGFLIGDKIFQLLPHKIQIFWRANQAGHCLAANHVIFCVIRIKIEATKIRRHFTRQLNSSLMLKKKGH